MCKRNWFGFQVHDWTKWKLASNGPIFSFITWGDPTGWYYDYRKDCKKCKIVKFTRVKRKYANELL